jgi:hypothetical protein
MTEPRTLPPKQVIFDVTPEIHATDTAGSFSYPLTHSGQAYLQTRDYDEIRFVFSLWHPSSSRSIDHDRSYVEVRASLTPDDEHWVKITEVEPVVAPYGGGDSFDGWVVLPILSQVTAFSLFGSGFEPRARLQIRASAYLVA